MRRPDAVGDGGETFRDAVADALKPVHVAVGEALSRLADAGITGRTYFSARGGILIIWLERPGEEP